MDKHMSSVAKNWNRIWYRHNKASKMDNILELLFYKIFPLHNLNRVIFNEIGKLSEWNLKDKKIAECGSGTGMISKKLAESGAYVTLIDISREAILLSKRNLKNCKSAKFIRSSILDIPIKDNAFDIVWNAGVIEHFKSKQQKKAIKEMLRITKPNGLVVLFNPSVYGKYYLKMKRKAELNKTWKAGYERPFKTLSNVVDKVFSLSEYSRGYWAQYHYGKYYFKNNYLQNLWILVHEILSKFLHPLDKYEGYFLVTVIRK